jgi:hypothetical protein
LRHRETGGSFDAQNPAFNLRGGTVRGAEMWRKKARQSLVTVEPAQATSNSERVVLVACPVFLRELLIPQSRVDFRDGRGLHGNVPTIERPEVQPAPKMLAQIQQPGKAGVSGAGYRARHIKVENRFCLAGAKFRKARPAGIAAAGRAISADSVPSSDRSHHQIRTPANSLPQPHSRRSASFLCSSQSL